MLRLYVKIEEEGCSEEILASILFLLHKKIRHT